MPPALRSALAVLGGLAVMSLMIAALTIAILLAFRTAHDGLPRGFLLTMLACSAVSALAGGYVTVALARSHGLQHTIALAVIVCGLGIWSVFHPNPDEPQWYEVGLAVIGPLFVLAGGHVRHTRRQRSLSPTAGTPTF